MKVSACMKEDEADFIKYSRIKSEKNAIDILSQSSSNHHLNQIRGNTKFDMYWWHPTWSHWYSIILPPQRLSWLTKKVFWRKASGHNSRQTSKGMSINKSARAWTSLKTNAIVSNFMTCARKNHWRSWVHLQRLAGVLIVPLTYMVTIKAGRNSD